MFTILVVRVYPALRRARSTMAIVRVLFAPVLIVPLVKAIMYYIDISGRTQMRLRP